MAQFPQIHFAVPYLAAAYRENNGGEVAPLYFPLVPLLRGDVPAKCGEVGEVG